MFIVYVKEINRVHHIHSQMIKINNIKSKKNKKKTIHSVLFSCCYSKLFKSKPFAVRFYKHLKVGSKPTYKSLQFDII